MFSKIYDEMSYKYKTLLFLRVHLLSGILNNVISMKSKLKCTKFAYDYNTKFYEMLHDELKCSKWIYLSDIYEILNKLNSSKQRKKENVLTSTDKP